MNMFKCLPKELLQEIFLYDPTYRNKYERALDTLVTPKMKALQYFLDVVEKPWDMRWNRMKKISSVHHNDLYEMDISSDWKMIACVMTLEERNALDDPLDITSPMILKNSLYRLPSQTVSMYTYVGSLTIDILQREISDPLECNDVLFDMLDVNGYSSLLEHIDEDGIYDREIHTYLLKDYLYDLLSNYGQEYENETEWFHFHYKGENYVVYYCYTLINEM